MASNDGTTGRPNGHPSPRKLWVEAAGDPDKYVELMIQHGHLVKATVTTVEPEIEPQDPWEQVAHAARVTAEVYAPLCQKCRKPVVLTESGAVKVHFANVKDVRPCPGSFKLWTG